MSAVLADKIYTPEEYLALERQKIDGKAEYVDGHIYAMTGASRKHNLITINIASMLHSQLRGRPCEAYANDMRVKAAKARSYFYPDLTVVCGQPELEDGHFDTLLNPTVLVEVLSPSTEAFDRGGKFTRYRRIASLQEYLLVSQDQALIEQYWRHNDVWILAEFSGLDALVKLEAIGCTLALREVYERVFDTDSLTPEQY